jgi:hypothetical protein
MVRSSYGMRRGWESLRTAQNPFTKKATHRATTRKLFCVLPVAVISINSMACFVFLTLNLIENRI